MPETFLSDKNPLLKDVRYAAQHGSLTKDGLALAEGPHLLEEALRSDAVIHSIIVAESARAQPSEFGVGPHTRVIPVTDVTFAGLSSTETSQGILTLVRPQTWTPDQLLSAPASLLIVLDGVQDPGNAGAILRAAEAFAATGAIFLKGSVNPYNPKCLRGSAGSIFRIPLTAGVSAEVFLKAAQKLILFAADPRATTTPAESKLDQPCALLIGAEGRGLSPALSGRSTGIRIPTSNVESLNAAVAAGILLYEARRQRASPSA
ncbi:MAG: RNA methyltransferase [Acidobacteriota bacterium]